MREDRLPPLPGEAATEQYAKLLVEARRIKGVSLGRDAWRRLRKNIPAMLSLVFLIMLALAALLTPLIPLQSPIHQDLRSRQFLPPNQEPVSIDLGKLTDPAEFRRQADNLWHQLGPLDLLLIRARVNYFHNWCIPSICGTDHLGRDVLARLFWGARVSLTVGIVATLVSLLIGVTYGAIAGYAGGRVDNAMMRLVDVLYSVPFIFVVIFLITFLNEDQING